MVFVMKTQFNGHIYSLKETILNLLDLDEEDFLILQKKGIALTRITENIHDFVKKYAIIQLKLMLVTLLDNFENNIGLFFSI